MFDLIVISFFFSMLLAPCVVASVTSDRDARNAAKAAGEAKP